MGELEVTKNHLGPGEMCLRLDALAALAEERLDYTTAEEAQRHLNECTYCRREMDLLLLFERGSARADEIAVVAQIERRVRAGLTPFLGKNFASQRWLAGVRSGLRSWKVYAAAGTFAGLAATGTLIYLPTARAPEIGQIDSAQTYRSMEIVGLMPVGVLSEAPKTLTWQPIAGASSYEVDIQTADESDLSETRSMEPSLKVPADVEARLKTDRAYLWLVTALDSSGRVLARSNQQRFYIRSKR